MGLNEKGLKGEKEEAEGGSTDTVRTQKNRGRSGEDRGRGTEGRKGRGPEKTRIEGGSEKTAGSLTKTRRETQEKKHRKREEGKVPGKEQ